MRIRGGTFIALVLALVASPALAQTVEYIHTDALGSPVAVTDANGVMIRRTEYAPYGEQVNRPVTDGPGFTGHVADAATELSYMQQRYYDPEIGRFLSVDPVTAHSKPGRNFNRYWYANNNPYKFTDPDGRDAFLFTDVNVLVVPVHFTGVDAKPENIAAIKQRFDALKPEFGNMKFRLQVLDKPGGAGTNVMNLSPEFKKGLFPGAGEGVYGGVGGNYGHINSSLGSWQGGAVHDILHFAGALDGYRDVGGRYGDRVTVPLQGYGPQHIMANRNGDSLRASDTDRIQNNQSTVKGVIRVHGGRIEANRRERGR